MNSLLVASACGRARLGLLAAVVLGLPLALAGCKSATSVDSFVCQPACPAGTTCTATGCVADGNLPDLSAARDLAPAEGCSPACAGAAPICNTDTHQCVPCIKDGDCPAGQQCKVTGATSACVTSCGDDARCAGLGAAPRCCGGQCVDTAVDVGNCGGCGTTCSPSHAEAACAGGACAPGACAAGWSDCNGDTTDGCETNVHVDPTNCGACKAGCRFANALAGCSGTCYIQACQFGYDDCDGKPENGCEVSVVSDVKNCGACGNSCTPPPHATSSCINAACLVTSCQVGFADCDKDAKNGCEVVTGSDAKNCGACGNACAQGLVCKNGGCTCPQCNFANASSVCINNVCVIDKCVMGFADCDGLPGNGCEVDVTTDVKNCGACNMACPQNTPFCIRGACAVQPPCANIGGGGLSGDNGTGKQVNYCYDQGDSDQQRAQKACESNFGIGKCCVIQGGYQNQQYGDCNLGGNQGSIHWHWDNHPNGHCAPNYVIGDVVSPGWCGNTLGNFLK